MCWIGTTHASPICRPPLLMMMQVLYCSSTSIADQEYHHFLSLVCAEKVNIPTLFQLLNHLFFLFPSFISHRLFDYPQVRRARPHHYSHFFPDTFICYCNHPRSISANSPLTHRYSPFIARLYSLSHFRRWSSEPIFILDRVFWTCTIQAIVHSLASGGQYVYITVCNGVHLWPIIPAWRDHSKDRNMVDKRINWISNNPKQGINPKDR